MYVDTMQQIFNNTTKVMVDNKSSNNLLYLPLDQLANRAAPAPAPAAAAAPVQPNVPASSAQQTHNLPGGDQPPLTPDASQLTSRLLSRTLR